MLTPKKLQRSLHPSKDTPSREYQSRSRVLLLTIFLVLFIFSVRLYHLQIIRHPAHLKQALKQQVRADEIVVPRGEIKDRKGRLLATSYYSNWLCADVYAARKKKTKVAADLSELTKMDEGRILSRLGLKKDYVCIKQDISSETIGAVEKMKRKGRLPGVKTVKAFKRFYPYHPVGSQLLGFTGMKKIPFREGLGRIREADGIEMIERSFDSVLQSRPGFYNVRVDQFQNPLKKTVEIERLPAYGNTLWLTLDISIQGIVEHELERALQVHGAEAGTVLVMNPATGEILAVANKPDGGTKKTNNWTNEERRNRAFSDILEPGSTLKPIILSMALAENVVDIDDEFYCGTGYKVGHKVYRDWKEFNRSMSVSEILSRSSNIGTIQIANRLVEKIGIEGYYKNLLKFGFGQKTGVPLPVESAGMLHRPDRYTPTSFSAISIGYEIGVTPLQLLTAYASIFNDGILMRPRIARAVVNLEGRILEKFPFVPVRRVMPVEVARSMKFLLKDAVENGTGKAASIEGCNIYGKTGTSRLGYGRRGRAYGYASTFIGTLIFKDLELAMLAIVYNPTGEYYGSLVSAPLFNRIGENILESYKLSENTGTEPKRAG